ncbi:MAG TPA: dihydroorotate dehydrogenase electron transfer subunit [Victivallales bacterium]|nr:dihydroorotate dehydrogenase electron transfer subunit [Victivallales bacterium]
MITENAKIIRNKNVKGEYYQIDFYSPEIVKTVQPGQFVHVQVTGLRDKIFRRPFSIFNVSNDGVLSLIYKVVGEGTDVLSKLREGIFCNLLGPLGSSYLLPENNEKALLVVGGYGSAATYLLAKKLNNQGTIFLGARNSSELILIDEYKELGFEVKIATEDGSVGKKGLVTSLLTPYLEDENLKIYACGPNPMMYAMGKMLVDTELNVELSLDHPMCCGVGACFACVLKVKADNKQGWEYARSCKEGPVFNLKDIYIG